MAIADDCAAAGKEQPALGREQRATSPWPADLGSIETLHLRHATKIVGSRYVHTKLLGSVVRKPDVVPASFTQGTESIIAQSSTAGKVSQKSPWQTTNNVCESPVDHAGRLYSRKGIP
jgi:hypothetical protein